MAREREFCGLTDIFEPLLPEIIRSIDRGTARYEFLLRDTHKSSDLQFVR